MSSRLVRNSVVLVVLAVFGLALLWTYFVDTGTTPEYTYSNLLTDAAVKVGNNDSKVASITQDETKLSVVLRNPQTGDPDTKNPRNVIVPSIANIDVQKDVCTAAGYPEKTACASKISYGAV
ncbi:MAG: hypothetical protein ACXWL8_05590, partial [Candidatus Limnocylindria bacterium]